LRDASLYVAGAFVASEEATIADALDHVLDVTHAGTRNVREAAADVPDSHGPLRFKQLDDHTCAGSLAAEWGRKPRMASSRVLNGNPRRIA